MLAFIMSCVPDLYLRIDVALWSCAEMLCYACVPIGDHLTLLNVYASYLEYSHTVNHHQRKVHQWCVDNCVSAKSMKKVLDGMSCYCCHILSSLLYSNHDLRVL